ncbi:TPA: tyrosine-type recombinase/integrase [Burkholderia contaminans]|uniref:tyrosine-type recombinase/integrase n=1 Tax=Burkholderia contaminans TaxID=488447 RepID=UPI000CFEC60F|nr:site-specific integrase [Burkholderia contaminans]HDR9065457.1 site-specific integrase [Burkholderia vietnamiensis]MBM6427896.1 site-specific integrase [Burkholderia contaminans]MCA7876727.1 site-specific integrase [Burkholderia contaminans]MDN8024250.1 site-specific integrase [Burkholderia contaminans]PRG14346.1 integrase [Burkholderia contaminans]
MATITARTRRDGTIGYTAQIRIKKAGKIIHTEAETFDRKQAAITWAKSREAELAKPGALDALKQPDPTLAEVIDQYIRESRRALGRTKEQVLRAIKEKPIGSLQCSQIDSPTIVAFCKSLTVQPQTVGNYLAHLAAVFTVARPAWNYPLSQLAIDDARIVAKKLGLTSRSVQRERRPSLDELRQILTHFLESRAKRVDSVDMLMVVGFALFSTRRLEEITRITWKDLDEGGSRVMVRDMKHPGQKIGNDQWCDLPPEALRIVQAMPRTDDRIFPWHGDAIGARFTRAIQFLGIDDLHFHDLRHEGISRLFEMGWNIPHVAAVSGHRSWTSLKRYTHLRQMGDKYAGWEWLDVMTAETPKAIAPARRLKIVA